MTVTVNVSINGGLKGETNLCEGKDGILTNSPKQDPQKTAYVNISIEHKQQDL